MLGRIISSVVAVLLYWLANFLLEPAATLVTGKIAGQQFEPSDAAYVASYWGMRLFSGFGIPAVILLIVIAAIWWKYLKRIWTRAVVLMVVLGSATPARAYFDTVDRNESYFIRPNQSAFWVPDVGDNKESQKKFMSEQYLEERKIPAKRYQVPHSKLENSAFWKDFYVPSGRLILVDRTPYSREWVDAHDRGTSTRKEGFPCQSSEGINMTLGISIGVSVLEEDSPRFLYRWGVYQDQNLDMSKPENQFQSVLYSRSLRDVMDNTVRNKVQSLVCAEYSKRTFDAGNRETSQIVEKMEENARKYLKSVGITLDFIGLADTINFDPEIQRAVNDAYVAQKLGPHIVTLERVNAMEVKRKWDGRLPWSMSEGLDGLIGRIFGRSEDKGKK